MVISQERARERTVLSTSNTGRLPAIEPLHQTAQLQVRDSDLAEAKLSYIAEQDGLSLYAIIINSFSHAIKTQKKANISSEGSL